MVKLGRAIAQLQLNRRGNPLPLTWMVDLDWSTIQVVVMSHGFSVLSKGFVPL